jgi:glycerol-3-phosphate acyltransferase PlsX
MSMRIGIDAMGGDHAPHEIVRGAVEGLVAQNGSELVLIGDEKAIRDELEKLSGWQNRVEIVPTTEVIAMDDSPVEAIRKKRNSSIVRMAALAAEKAVDAVISAGNTGACAAACQLKIEPIRGVHRPGIAVVIPSFHGPLVVCDVGANIAAKPKHLHQYAIMASLYSREVLGVQKPRVGLLSVGEEDAKGTSVVKKAHELIRSEPAVNFVGNVEGRDLFRGAVDVVVCDGFVGNIVLKLTEGLAEGLFKTISAEIAAASPHLAEDFKPVVNKVWSNHDYSEYGGAPLLGVDGICIICHGSSDHRAIRNAVRVASNFVQRRLNTVIAEGLAKGR